MTKLYTIDSIKFGFKSFAKNFNFLFLATLASGLIFIGGITIIALISMLFFIPAYMFQTEIKEVFAKAFALDAFKSIAEKLGSPDQSSAANAMGEVKNAWTDAMSKIFSNYPYVMASAILGIKIFIILALCLLIMQTLGFVKISLDIFDGKELRLKSLFVQPKLLFRGIAINLMNTLAVLIPVGISILLIAYYKQVLIGSIILILTLIEIFYFGFKFALNMWVLIDKKTNIFETYKLSFKIKGAAINILLTSLLLALIFMPINLILKAITSIGTAYSIFGLINMIIQIFLVILTLLSITYIYHKLTAKE